MINTINASFFLTGLYIGGYSNFFSKIVITGLVIHMANQSIFSYEKFKPLYNNVKKLVNPYLSKIYQINPTQSKSPRLNVINKK